MQLAQSFEVTAPLETVWEALIDVQRVAPCLPGAEVTGRNDDGSYDGTFKVKIGPTAAAYTGKLRMESVDEATHTARMDAQGTDRRGQGGAKATIISSVAAVGPGATRVDVSTDYHITGRLARFGRGGMIEEISNRLLNEFAKSLQEMLGGDPATAATVLRPVHRPGPAAAAAAQVEAAAAQAELAGAAGAEAVDTAPDEAVAAMPEQTAAAPPTAAAAPPPPPPPPPPAPARESEPIHGLSLVGSVLWSRAKSNPVPIAAVVIGLLMARRLLRRRG